MSQLPSSPTDVIQSAQTALGKLQMQYRDSQLEFHALGVAWEAARFAWYVVSGDLGTAADKLQLLDDWIATYRRMSEIANAALRTDDLREEMSREVDEDLAALALYPTWAREAREQEQLEAEAHALSASA
jgi:hypothetical protein